MTGQFIVRDPYFKKAKALGYRARSAFKLLEIQEKFHLIERNMNVLDLASAPGSFLQVISHIIGQQGRVVGIDLQKIDSF
jgi:23S rRNA (uridine2552-2'-O)-methyltransferase